MEGDLNILQRKIFGVGAAMDFESRGSIGDKGKKGLHGCNKGIHVQVDVIASDGLRKFFCSASGVATGICGSHECRMKDPPIRISISTPNQKPRRKSGKIKFGRESAKREKDPQNSFGSVGL